MVIDDNPFIEKLGGIDGVRPSEKPESQDSKVKGADFARILEELTAAAGKLSEAGLAKTEDAQSLKEAVGEAEKSLDKAISLSENLLEEYRRAIVVDPKKSQ